MQSSKTEYAKYYTKLLEEPHRKRSTTARAHHEAGVCR